MYYKKGIPGPVLTPLLTAHAHREPPAAQRVTSAMRPDSHRRPPRDRNKDSRPIPAYCYSGRLPSRRTGMRCYSSSCRSAVQQCAFRVPLCRLCSCRSAVAAIAAVGGAAHPGGLACAFASPRPSRLACAPHPGGAAAEQVTRNRSW
jgi:hypothetical protein